MRSISETLSSSTLNWNAAVGSVGAVSLSTDSAAVNLHSYKFYFARAIRFAVRHGDRELRPESVAVTWHPHKMRSRVTYPGVTLDLEAFFVDKETVAVRYVLAAGREMDLDVAVCGTARNGTSLDGYFHHRGRVVAAEDDCVVEQEVDIPDYRMRPIGPARLHTHHHIWVVHADEPIAVSQDVIEHDHPERIGLNGNDHRAVVNRSNHWLLRKRLSLKPREQNEGRFFIGTRWQGPKRATPGDIAELRRAVCVLGNRPLGAVERELVAGWDGLLGDVPLMKGRYRDNDAYRDLYHKAWVCIFQNVADGLVTSRKTIGGPTALVGKACSNGFGPAQWETSLAGFLVSFVRPDVGIGIIESVLGSAEIDGFVPEDLVFNRDVKLSSYEPFMLDYIRRRTGRTEFLERNFDNALRQLIFHLRHPAFYYLDSHPTSLGMDNYYSLVALRRIAGAIGKGPEEIRLLQDEIEDAERMLAETTKGWESGRAVYSAIYGCEDDRRARDGIAFIRDHMIPPAGRCFLYESPDGKDKGKDNPRAFKMNGYLFLILALERLGAADLLDLIVTRTFEGLEANGDFWECYYVDGGPWGNGPMSIFGAFGWVWSVMDKQPAPSNAE